jgi:hypothetical protein
VSPKFSDSAFHNDHDHHHDSHHQHHHRDHRDHEEDHEEDHVAAGPVATPKARGALVPPRSSKTKSHSSPEILSAISQAVLLGDEANSTPRKNGFAKNGSGSSVSRGGGIGGKDVQSHVEKQTMGGTTRLVRRTGGSKGSGIGLGGGGSSGYEESTESYPGLGKRKVDEDEVELQVQINRSSQRTRIEGEGEADEGEEDEGEVDEGEFDPTAEVRRPRLPS